LALSKKDVKSENVIRNVQNILLSHVFWRNAQCCTSYSIIQYRSSSM